MKLYYKPGACSLASHIALHEVGTTFDIEAVDTASGVTANGDDYSKINPKGYVPALKIDSGEVITEGPAILQFIADQFPQSDLAPKVGTVARARLHEYLNYVGSELHTAFSPFFAKELSEDDKKQAVVNTGSKFNYLNTLFSDGRQYLLGDQFTVADAYLFVVSNWSNFVGINLDDWPNIANFVTRVSERPATIAAMKTEGLVN